jgi:predicted GH43/DUF377 family glycosyl hydrolase
LFSITCTTLRSVDKTPYFILPPNTQLKIFGKFSGIVYLCKKTTMDYSMIMFFGMVVVTFGVTILHEYITEKRNKIEEHDNNR